MDNTDIFILNKDKVLVSTNGIEVYNKKVLNDEIRRLTATNVQLMIDKIETEKARINLKADKIRLFGKKNSLVIKKEELRIEIVVLNAVKLFNILVYRH